MDAWLREKALKEYHDGKVFLQSRMGGLLLSSAPEIISGCHANDKRALFFREVSGRLQTVREIPFTDLGPGPGFLDGPTFLIPLAITGEGCVKLHFRPSSLDMENPIEAFQDFWFPVLPDGVRRSNHP
jgi:hypothetical protein